MQKKYVAGIIAEYNPFHNGHAHMIEQVRKQGYETVVCVMSGAFVQRAEPAILPPAVRAKAAIQAGADLVLRLPLPWAAASAELFAHGGVSLLQALGCVDALAFGAETADADALQNVAQLLLEEEFTVQLKKELAEGISFAAARAKAAEALLPGAAAILNTPNNTLAVEYCKALLQSAPQAVAAAIPPNTATVPEGAAPIGIMLPPVKAIAVPRLGAQHDGPPTEGIASASWLRTQNGVRGWEDYVPPECMPVYEQAEREGLVCDATRYEIAALARLRGKTTEEFALHAAAGEGLEVRCAKAVKEATTLEELYAAAKTKRYAHSRVRRLCLQAVLGIPKQLPVLPPFAHVLAASGRGLALLSQIQQNACIPVGTALAKLQSHNTETAEIARLEAAAEDLYTLCLQTPQRGGGAYTQPAYIDKKTE